MAGPTYAGRNFNAKTSRRKEEQNNWRIPLCVFATLRLCVLPGSGGRCGRERPVPGIEGSVVLQNVVERRDRPVLDPDFVVEVRGADSSRPSHEPHYCPTPP